MRELGMQDRTRYMDPSKIKNIPRAFKDVQ